jgi:hypothetical protein
MQQLHTKPSKKKTKVLNNVFNDPTLKAYGTRLSRQSAQKDTPEKIRSQKSSKAVLALRGRYARR